MRLDVARVQDEGIVQLISLLHPGDLLVVGRLAEPLVDRVVDHVDLSLGDPEVPQDVAFRRLGHRQHAVGAVRCHPQRRSRVGVRQAARQVLREAQVEAVVDVDHRPAGHERRQHVVRRVEQVRALAAQVHRNAELLAERVRGRGSGTARKFSPSSSTMPQSGRGKITYSVVESNRDRCRAGYDVGADAVIAQLARIDGDSQVRGFYRGNCPLIRR